MKKVASNESALVTLVLLACALATVGAATCRTFNPTIAATILFGVLGSALILALKTLTNGFPFGTVTISELSDTRTHWRYLIDMLFKMGYNEKIVRKVLDLY